MLIANDDWLGLLQTSGLALRTMRIYPKFTQNVPYHKLGWW